MGYLMYEGVEYSFDDRVLAHLKAAIGRKLRKHESFFLNWGRTNENGGGRISLWLSPSSGLVFRFEGSRAPLLDEMWLRVLAALSETPSGMEVMTERDVQAYVRNHPEFLVRAT